MVFNYVITLAIFISVAETQFYSLESDIIGYPIQFTTNQGSYESGNIYYYNINNYGINSLIDNFIIGSINFLDLAWIYNYGYYDKQLVMQINEKTVNIVLYQQYIQVLHSTYDLWSQINLSNSNSWIYVYYKQNKVQGLKQICYVQIYNGPYPYCMELPESTYQYFGFFQSTSDLWDYFYYYDFRYIESFTGQAISITIKKMITFDSPDLKMIDQMTLLSYVEPEVVLDLKIYERYQTKILKDWSNYQHIVQMGNSLDDDINDPQIIINDQLLSFQNQQYIYIDNFKIEKTVTIEFQLLYNQQSEQSTLFTFSSRRSQQEIMQIQADFINQYIYVNFKQPLQSFSCSMIFGQKFLVSIVNLVQMTIIMFIQNENISCLNPFMGEISITNTDTLYIGSNSNSNSQPFQLTSVRISNGFYSPYQYIDNGICAYSIDQCFYCLNGLYLYQGQCVSTCPTYYVANELRKECIPKCHPTCLDCDQANPTQCFICAGIRINVPECKCPTGYFDDGISPECIRYLPDQTVDEGTYEFQCDSPIDTTYQISFSKNYYSPPLVAISLIGHIDLEESIEFQVFVNIVYNNYFELRAICKTSNGRYKIQWVAGKSSRFQNVIQQHYSGSFSSTYLYPGNSNMVSGGILGWCLQSKITSSVSFDLNQSGFNSFYFTANQYLNLLKYQFFEFTDYVYYSFNEYLSLSTQNTGFSIGGATITYWISQYPLTIPTLFSLKRLSTQNSYSPQYFINQKKKAGQIEFKIRTLGNKYFDYLAGDLIYFTIECIDPFKPCDYIQELQKCNKILSGCSCSSRQYLDLGQNVCKDCDPNCLTCSDYFANCQSCSIESKKQLILDIYTNYFNCRCAINQYEDMNGICQDCDPNCYECYMQPTYCISCGPNQIVNAYNQCECYYDSTLTENGCELCQPPCSTCETTVTNCLSCLYLGQVLPTCQCPTGQQVVDGQCIQYCPILCMDCIDQTSCNQCVALSSYNPLSNACECQNGYFSNSIECQMCESPCQNCISLTECTSCINQTYYIDITCIQCISPCLECTASNYCLTCINDSYYLSNNLCVSCQSPCLTCYNLNLCKSCINDSYYYDDTLQLCEICIPPCLTCETNLQCKTCISSFYYLSSMNTCLNCVSPCNTCSSETQCLNCISGYYIDANMSCQQCVSPCTLCSTVDICDSCLDGYFLESNNTCQSCTKPCQTCQIQSTNCLSCTDVTMIISGGTCNCASNQFYDTINSICQNCHPTCTTCSNQNDCCLASELKQLNIDTNLCDCQNGYYMLSNTCTLCNSPCSNCTSSSVCTTCIDGYYLSGDFCQICTSPCQNCVNASTQCLSCVGVNMIITNNLCTCPSQHYMNAAQTDCIQCHPTCLTCTDSNNCCFSAEYKILDSINNVCKCIDGYYFDSDGICQKCDKNCLTCETTATNCLSCDTKFQLDISVCKCFDSHQFINDLGLCENCSTNCLTCSTNANNCLSCDDTKKYQLINNICQCKTNEYLNDNGICTQCHNTCTSCVNGTDIGCLICISSRKMNPENKLCECANGYYQNDNSECIKCNSKCGKCLNDHECLTCSENRSLDQDGVSCICNIGFFENEKQVCQKCSPPCSTCTSASDCLSCIDVNREVVESRCICKKGFFENEQNQCESCTTIKGKVNDICNYINCGDGELTKGEQCDDGNKNSRDGCTDCKIDSLFTCVNKMLSRSICFQCVPHCQTCSLKGYRSSCDQCYDGYYLKENECFKCSDMCYTCKDNKTCLTCTIIDAKPDEKGTCPKCTNVKGYYIVNRKCVTKCGDAIIVEGELCDDGNNLDGDGCDSKCQVEKYYTCKQSTCTKIPQPQVEATYTNSTTSDSMFLNFPIDQGDPCTKINITIDQFLPNEFQSFINYEQIDENNSKCNIDFSFNKTIDLGNLIHIFIPVKVRTSRRVLEEETREIIITPRKKVIYSQNQVQQAESASNAQSALGEMLYFIAPTVIVLGGFNFFWTIMDILSWINNLYYINIYFPENVRMFFQKSAWGDFQLFPAFFVLNEPTDPYYIESPKKFMEKGVDPIFLNNTWTCFAIIAITISVQILSCLILVILEFIWPPVTQKTQLSSIKIFQLNETKQSPSNKFKSNTENKFTKIKMQKAQVEMQNKIILNPKKRFPYLIDKIYQPLHKFKINFLSNFIKSLNLAFLDLVLAIILQITTIPSSLMDYQIVFINQILSYVSISVCVFTLIISYYVTTKHHMLLDHEIFQNQYGTLYESINTKSSTAMMYSFINLNRKALFIIVVVYFYYQPLLQTVFSCFISFLNIALILYENPFTSNAELIQNGVPDFCIFVLMLLSTGFALDDIIGVLNADQRFQIGWLMIGTIGLSIFVQVIFLLREFIRDLQEKFLIIVKKIQNCLKSQKKL
ncbi:unnamed protein product [Paramecium primaurelia]|uniref:EGF-like domain-containing protein n=1 Tax=Paramecium primaurelia TaxID=5886 RepID=A0A8S1L5C3_PARPR|nr:unnamed protein product [Paramecium primaurelia]